MSNLISLKRRAQLASERSSELCRSIHASNSVSPELLAKALIELGVVSEAMGAAIAELTQKSEQLASAQMELDTERQRYLNLFEFVTDGCLVTDAQAVILDVNPAGATTLAQSQSLIGKPLTSLIYSEDLPLFQVRLSQVLLKSQVGNGINFSVRLYRQTGSLFHATLTANVRRHHNGEILYIQWLLRDNTERKRAEAALDDPHYNPGLDRPLVHYSKGENVPLEPHIVWLITDGVVKVTTLSERGEEMLVGLLGKPMVFGSSLTALQTYQAIALSDVKLAAIPLSEVAQSPQLAQALLRSLKQRLQQTESLLAINGHIHVEERLTSLLTLLKRTLGQPIEQGIRLQARLTHQDFAQACRTTRVTVTRVLGKLQEQGKLLQDDKNHLIWKDACSKSKRLN
ncbi:MAG: PAS domain S-box protein [Stenomitos rutilans HA7619-LM2]|jgi:PAS domain S-box-containing protein|nr:PAS domain S-box protein [Stenomitos rutilans HA7619-LM2]